MKKWLFLMLITASVSIHSAYAQDEEPGEKTGFDKSKLFFGGSFGLTFGDYTVVNVTPQIGYRFNRYLAAGTGINVIYSSMKYRDYNGDLDYKTTYGVGGLNIFGRVYPIEQILLQVQPEMNYIWGEMKTYKPTEVEQKLDTKFAPALLMGAGAVIPAGRGGFVIMIQYDVLNSEPYGNQLIYSFGFNVGF